ncbi:acetate kinase [Dichotomocladium elegans]|nr:acetate kinase [Dichotomocladium elegans]
MYLVFNAGSSSLKFKVFDVESLHRVSKGQCSEIGTDHATFQIDKDEPCSGRFDSHEAAVDKVLESLKDVREKIVAVGHRVVHGGDRREPIKVTGQSLKELDTLTALAPLHNHRAVTVMRVTLERMPNVDCYAYFDTLFHATIPPFIYHYPLPREQALAQNVRKWGFHGISHNYVAHRAAEYLAAPLKNIRIISLHLGNGSSACAIANGKSVDTSMGMTPVSGLPGGTRSGDVDPASIFHLVSNPADTKKSSGVQLAKAEHVLNKESGLKGLCGCANVQEILQKRKHDKNAQLAIDVFVNRIQNFIGAYFVTLGGCDALLFTGGIGEHSAEIRQRVCEKLSCLGCKIDEHKNGKAQGPVVDISFQDSSVKVLVVETDEELQIAKCMKDGV